MCGSYRKQLQELQSSRGNIDEVMKKNRELSAQLEEKEASMKSLLEESKKSQQKYGLSKQLIDGIHFVQKRHHTGTIDFIEII